MNDHYRWFKKPENNTNKYRTAHRIKFQYTWWKLHNLTLWSINATLDILHRLYLIFGGGNNQRMTYARFSSTRTFHHSICDCKNKRNGQHQVSISQSASQLVSQCVFVEFTFCVQIDFAIVMRTRFPVSWKCLWPFQNQSFEMKLTCCYETDLNS